MVCRQVPCLNGVTMANYTEESLRNLGVCTLQLIKWTVPPPIISNEMIY